MMTARKSVLNFIFLAVISFSSNTQAWNAAGHQLSSAITWELLSEQDRNYWVDILKHHPRFIKDFKNNIPQFVKFNPDNYNEWIFRQAATWPDMARGFHQSDKDKYHHSTWHYINYPLFLNESVNTDFVNLDEHGNGKPNHTFNILQALETNIAILKNQAVDKQEKAVALCWVLHLIGDLHQPLHSTALFSTQLFSEGDRGGNSIKIRGQGQIENLHWFWDSRLNETTSFKVIDLKAKKLLEKYSDFKPTSNESTFPKQAKQSHQIAIKYVYTPVLLDLLRKYEGQNNTSGKIYISNIYDQQARKVSEKQIVKASFYIAIILKSLQG